MTSRTVSVRKHTLNNLNPGPTSGYTGVTLPSMASIAYALRVAGLDFSRLSALGMTMSEESVLVHEALTKVQ